LAARVSAKICPGPDPERLADKAMTRRMNPEHAAGGLTTFTDDNYDDIYDDINEE
jgi:hypothetical protein